MRRLPFLIAAVAILALAVPSGPAAGLTLTADHQGRWSCCPLDWRGFGSFTGSSSGVEYRPYLVFNITTVDGPVSGGVVRLWNPLSTGSFGGYQSPDPEETLALFDVTSPIPWVINRDLGGYDVFVDLGTGTPYGSVSVSDADEGVWVEVPLNADGVAALNAEIAAGRPRFAFGLALTTITLGFLPEYIFSQSAELAQLVLAVPEADASVLLAAGVVVVAAARRRAGRSDPASASPRSRPASRPRSPA